MNTYLGFSPTCQITGLDVIYRKYFGKLKKGIFVEVGAFDGETHSNTSGLADYGWRGIYVEPVLAAAKLCKIRHQDNNVEVVNCLVGADHRKRNIKLAGELSTTIDNPKALYASVGLHDLYQASDLNKTIEVTQVPLNYILSDSDIPKRFHLLILDTEGMECEILNTLDFTKYHPKMIIVEMHEEDPLWEAVETIKYDNYNINKRLADNGYKKIFKDSINSIFVNVVH